MGRSKEMFEDIRNESSTDEEEYYINNYVETVTIGCIYK
jgi:hypothetical protein